jgi:hypothetical protein
MPLFQAKAGASIFPWVAAFLPVLTAGLCSRSIQGEEPKGVSMSYREVREFLEKNTKLIELTNPEGARVIVCPEWQGRVMTSTCDGLDGPSFGFVNREHIEAGKVDLHFNNYGAEERLWLSPEGGQFSLWFKPGAQQNLTNWYTPPAFNEGAWHVAAGANDSHCRMTARMTFQNASGTPFDLDVAREVRLLGAADLAKLFGEKAARAMTQQDVKIVGYETANTLTNRGSPMTKEGGLVSIWILGMMNAGPQAVTIVPYRGDSAGGLGPVVKSDYFGPVPEDRLKIEPEAILFRADSKYRSKIGVSQRRASKALGSIDFQGGVLTLVHFSMPGDPRKHLYMNNMWQVPQSEPYVGDVVNAYNDGPSGPGKKGMGAFYEIESLSPAAVLGTGQSLTHQHRTVHIQAAPATLHRLAKEVLGVDLDKVRTEMLAPR